jgi:hypothetical protein
LKQNEFVESLRKELGRTIRKTNLTSVLSEQVMRMDGEQVEQLIVDQVKETSSPSLEYGKGR